MEAKEITMTLRDAQKIAQKIAAKRATVSPHYRVNRRRDRAIRITGCFLSEAENVGRDIAKAVNGTLRSDGGFVAVWL